MKIPELAEIARHIKDGTVPLVEMFADVDCDALLDVRDSDLKFDTVWRTSLERIEKLRFILNRDLPEPVQQAAFKAVSNVTQQHEIASYVSDDFELIGWQSFLFTNDSTRGYDDPTINWLWSEYSNGRFPIPPMPNAPNDT